MTSASDGRGRVVCQGEEAAAAALTAHTGPLRHATFVNTGSEAVHLACCMARAVTGKSLVAKFAAGYDGWYDDLAFGNCGSAEATMQGARPVKDRLTLLRYNDLDDVDALFRERQDVAAVLIEPVLANAGCIMPEPGYLAYLQDAARRHGACVILDEVLMGFRIRPGLTGLHLGLDADLATLGKAIGSGVPVAAVVGKPELMAALTDGRVTRAGTYNGNPLVTAAVTATMSVIGDIDYAALLAAGDGLRADIERLFARAGLAFSTSGYGTVFSLWFAETPPRRYEDALKSTQPGLASALHAALRRHGVLTIPSPWGRLYRSIAHRERECELTLAAFQAALETELLARGPVQP